LICASVTSGILSVGVGEGSKGMCPLNSGKIFSGKYHVKFWHLKKFLYFRANMSWPLEI